MNRRKEGDHHIIKSIEHTHDASATADITSKGFITLFLANEKQMFFLQVDIQVSIYYFYMHHID
jgi:hypothetical protein